MLRMTIVRSDVIFAGVLFWDTYDKSLPKYELFLTEMLDMCI